MPERKAGRTAAFALSWAAYASYYLGRKGFSVTKASIARTLGLDPAALAAIDTCFLFAYAVGQLPSGMLADRIGARRLVAAGLLVSALACALFGAANTALALGGCFALNGIAQSTGWPGTTKMMADATPVLDRGRVMGLWSTCYQIGGIAATALATALLAAYGWRSAFYVPALWLVVMGALVWLFGARDEPPPRAFAADAAAVDGIAPAPRGGAPMPVLPSLAPPPLRAIGTRVLYCYGACYFCLKLIRYSLLFWLPYYLHTEVGFDETRSGYLSTSFEIGGAFGSIALGWISDRIGGQRAKAAAVSILGLALALWAYARLGEASMPAHFALMALIGALLFGPDALISGAAAQDAGGPSRAATAVGMVNGVGSFGALLQGVLIVSVQEAIGWGGLFYAFFALALIASACLLPAVRSSSA